jgi:tRNA uridine 5-carboxymethylaminomethyl modification enzyme
VQERRYQVVIIGGGHAGVEAAWAAANLLGSLPGTPSLREGSRVSAPIALITLDPTKIGVMSCNPAIGGLAKGQLVREIDAMGGLMGLASDATGIQFKVLNQSKGPAVQGPRAQCDKHAYAKAVQLLIASRPEIEVIGGSVERLVVEGHRLVAVDVRLNEPGASATGPMRPRSLEEDPALTLGVRLRCEAAVLTTGTFMRGLMHTGEAKTPGGRHGEAAAHAISDSLRELGFELGRLKTGTPPRLKRESIRWEGLDEQPGDEVPQPFSDLTGAAFGIRHSAFGAEPGDHDLSRWWRAEQDHEAADALLHAWRDNDFQQPIFPLIEQVGCRMTATNAAAHATIRANLHRAPMYSGQIDSTGPRYCPSIEDKVVRFADRESHGVFLEPESHASNWVYCNGISTSLPLDVQDQLVRTMAGCEHAEILRYGYAVEYDMVRPHQINVTGETKPVANLFLAGQINGTSGYEEAAAQGLIAGINAARRALAQPEFALGRDQAYIGVLMDDLVTKTPREPYRMFTSRAEHRLLLRSDNAWKRLTPLARELGLLSTTELGRRRIARFHQLTREVEALDALAATATHDNSRVEKLLRGQTFEVEDFQRTMAVAVSQHTPGRDFDPLVWRHVHAERRYAAYIVRQHAEVRRQADLEHKRLPDDIDYTTITHLRPEARHALHRFRPRTFGQAARLEGLTPADITLLSVLVARK